MQLFARKLAVGEALLAMVSFLGVVLTAIANLSKHPLVPSIVAIACGATVTVGWILFLALRRSFVLVGYDETMRYLELMSRRARHYVWTARAHVGDAQREDHYFEILRARVIDPDDPLPDLRRIMRFRSDPAPRRHGKWLFDNFGKAAATEVRYFTGGGPKFDFAIFDGTTAVIGFPIAGGTGVVASIVLKGLHAVRGVEAAFDDLWNECDVLFKGSTDTDVAEQQERQRRFEAILGTFAPIVERTASSARPVPVPMSG